MEGIKEAFIKVKNDIDLLKKEFYFYEENIKEDRLKILEICEILEKINKKIDIIEDKNNYILSKIEEKKQCLDKKQDNKTHIKTEFFDFLVNSVDVSTGNEGLETNKTHIKTDRFFFKPLNGQNIPISTGNQGVQTDKQTDRQTDNQTEKSSYNKENSSLDINTTHNNNSIDSAKDMLDSLDSIKKEIRLKFRRLTDQEMLVFSTIYQQDDEFGYSDYKMIAKKISLTESSIRDYVRRLINKGIPIDKDKINNKEIRLFISPNLKKIASLDTILTLKDI